MSQKLLYLISFVLVLGLALSVPAGAEQFLVEHFNYANGADLNGQVAGQGGWVTDGGNYMVLNDDRSGDGGTSSLQYPGMTDSQGGRLTPAGDCSYMLTTPVVGEGNVAYLSVLIKPTAISTSYFIHFETDGSVQWQLGRLRGRDSGGDQGFGVSIRGSGPAGWSDNTVALGETALVVIKLTMVPGADNDAVEIWVNPTVGTPEPPADARSSPDSGNDVDPAIGIRGFVFRSSGAKEVDEIRFGTTWDDVAGGAVAAFAPNPEDEMIDVLRNTVLSWTSGDFAAPTNGHKVYFGESFNDVNDGIGGITQSAASYAPPQRLEFGTTYYWRVDEISAPPDSTVYPGEVWSFTAELLVYPIENVTATASSSNVNEGAENTVNDSGVDANDLHSTETTDMWLSSPDGDGPAWIEYEFDKVSKLHEMWVWNHNSSLEQIYGLGFKDVSVEYSADGIDYKALGTTHEFAQAPGTPDYAHETTIDFDGAAAKYVRLTANSTWGSAVSGLSEVRFFRIPVRATEPYPDSGATDVDLDVVLGWKAGRDAVSHDVYVNADPNALNLAGPVTEPVFDTASLDLELGQIYSWRVDEVNDAETTTTWQSDIWSFTTVEYLVVEDFESYNDIDPPDPESHTIFGSWSDGYLTPTTNGALVGYEPAQPPSQPSYMEHAIVYDGDQSMPFSYNNTGGAASSEAELTLTPAQDWTAHGIQTLSLWFYGDAANTPGQLYVKINGVQVLYDGDATNLTRPAWQVWNIELALFVTDLQNVTSIAIGVQGNGAAGTLLFDDIRLYALARQLMIPVQPDPAGLVAHFALDGNANDSVGNNHGTLQGNPQWVIGYYGNALAFDGTGDWLECGNDPSLGISGAVSFTAWIKIGAAGIDHKVGGNQDNANGGYKMGINSDKIEFEIRTSANTSVLNRNVAGGTILQAGLWYQVTGVYSQQDGYIRTYVNGLMDRELLTTAVLGASPGTLYIGCEPYNTDNGNFNGVMDDVRIYNRALSDAEIAGLAGMTKPFDKPF